MAYETKAGRETVTAFFETRTTAQTAIDRLRNAGVDVAAARLHEGGDPSLHGTAAPERETHRKGFWESLGELFLPHEDRDAYAEGLTRGGTLLSLPVSDADRALVYDILDDEGTIDLDERQTTWRSDGWGGPATSPVFGDAGLSTRGDAGSSSREDPGRLAGETGHVPRTEDAALRSGIAGVGARAAGEPQARIARRDASLNRGRFRSYLLDDEDGEGHRENEVIEVEDERSLEETRRDRATGRSVLDR